MLNANPPSPLSLLLLFLSPSSTITTNSPDPYTRYPLYPPYCSTPTDMSNNRTIPALNTTVKKSHILQVNAIIRHGQRTPWTPLNCWSGYSTADDTGHWDCSLTSIMSPTSGSSSSNSMSFEKTYDALQSPQSNLLNGTCLLGQLLNLGYDQEIMNAKILRKAYISAKPWNPNNGRRRLQKQSNSMDLYWGISGNFSYYDSSLLYFRGDDEQRTLLSGEILLRGLFGLDASVSSVKVHLADKERDILEPNEQICPRLIDLRTTAENSDEFKSVDDGKEGKMMRSALASVGAGEDARGEEPVDDIIDCLMTTMCTDRELPTAFDDYGEEEGLFDQLVDFATWRYAFPLTYDNAAYAKLGMGPLWAEIYDKIKPTRSINSINDAHQNDAPRMALYSGHDTTIMPLLASLGLMNDDIEWTPYASMLIIEVHLIPNDERYPTNHAFRLLYNGKVLTPQLPSCPPDDDLCDLSTLHDIIKPFATRDGDCDRLIPLQPWGGGGRPRTSTTTADTNTPEPMAWLFFLIMVVSGVVGSLMTFVCMMGKFPCQGEDARVERQSLKNREVGGEGVRGGEGGDEWSSDTNDMELI